MIKPINTAEYGGRIRAAECVSHSLVGAGIAVGYELGMLDGEQAQRELPPDPLHKLDGNLEIGAVVCGQSAWPVAELRRILGVA